MATKLSAAERNIMALTVLGESGDEGADSMAAVAYTMLNRANSGSYPANPALVAIQHNFSGSTYQYDAAKNLSALAQQYPPSSAAYQQAASIVDGVVDGTIADPTGGGMNYYANKGINAIPEPDWFPAAAAPHGAVQINHQIFTIGPKGIPVSGVPLPQDRPQPDAVQTAVEAGANPNLITDQMEGMLTSVAPSTQTNYTDADLFVDPVTGNTLQNNAPKVSSSMSFTQLQQWSASQLNDNQIIAPQNPMQQRAPITMPQPQEQAPQGIVPSTTVYQHSDGSEYVPSQAADVPLADQNFDYDPLSYSPPTSTTTTVTNEIDNPAYAKWFAQYGDGTANQSGSPDDRDSTAGAIASDEGDSPAGWTNTAANAFKEPPINLGITPLAPPKTIKVMRTVTVPAPAATQHVAPSQPQYANGSYIDSSGNYLDPNGTGRIINIKDNPTGDTNVYETHNALAPASGVGGDGSISPAARAAKLAKLAATTPAPNLAPVSKPTTLAA